ncbi:hypothetical protein PMAYCL1PPCAC_15816, partial [Pristionchus mayeri]
LFYNCGNYKSFGDKKFIPSVPAERVRRLISSSKAASLFPDLLSIYGAVQYDIFCLDKTTAELGFNSDGVTTYHSENVSKEDSDLVNRYMKEKKLEAWNTRLFKQQIDGKTALVIKSASINAGSTVDEFEGVQLVLEKGDYSEILLRKVAREYAANDKQKEVIDKYVDHFTTGDLQAHREASRVWIRDVDPAVEAFIGFFREYRDPAGMRAEFKGLVTAVNKEVSKKFSLLVEKAEQFLPRLPWGKAYEKDK